MSSDETVVLMSLMFRDAAGPRLDLMFGGGGLGVQPQSSVFNFVSPGVFSLIKNPSERAVLKFLMVSIWKALICLIAASSLLR